MSEGRRAQKGWGKKQKTPRLSPLNDARSLTQASPGGRPPLTNTVFYCLFLYLEVEHREKKRKKTRVKQKKDAVECNHFIDLVVPEREDDEL